MAIHSNYHDTSESYEDRDFLLEYKSIDLTSLKSNRIFGVPVSDVTRDEAVACVLDMIEKKDGPHYVFFVDPIKLMRIRKKRLNFICSMSRLILPDGAGLQWAANRLGLPLKERIPMISFLMDVVRLARKKDFTIYILGSRPDYVERVFSNMQKSFPGLRIIGRQSGYFDRSREALIKESIRKSAPDIIFLGMGFPKQERWVKENWKYLSRSVVIGVDGALDILSGKARKAPDWAQVRGLIWFWRTITRPWNLGRVFVMTHFITRSLFRAVGE
jgi:N-acetylglucosaminyldiphosphoundecaprenol N-acetyl-beta-D-mannosaminyltransferase